MYCPPINHKRFEEEMKERYKLSNEWRSTTYESDNSIESFTASSCESELSSVVSNPIKVYKVVRDFFMVSDICLVAQLIHTLILIHLLIKSIIYATFVGENLEKIEYFDSIYYPHIAGVSARPYTFNYLILGYLIYYVIVKITRFRSIINISLKNEHRYTDLRISQLNSAYLASLYLSFKEWIILLKYLKNHDECAHSDEATKVNHLKFNSLIQQMVPKLSNIDKMFFVNLFDFDKCYEDSVLPKYVEPRKLYKEWHLPYPIQRISCTALKDVMLITILGFILVIAGFITLLISLAYLELRTEFSDEYAPSIVELISVFPGHFLKLIYWIRISEAGIMFLTHLFNQYDLFCAFLDIHTMRSRTYKMVQIFENHIEFLRQKTQIFDDYKKQERELTSKSQFLLGTRLIMKQGSLSDYYVEYNKQLRDDIVLISFLYRELLNIKRHHNEFFNVFVIAGAASMAYLIPILVSQPISVETVVLVTAVISSMYPIICVLVLCARMERMVSLL